MSVRENKIATQQRRHHSLESIGKILINLSSVMKPANINLPLKEQAFQLNSRVNNLTFFPETDRFPSSKCLHALHCEIIGRSQIARVPHLTEALLVRYPARQQSPVGVVRCQDCLHQCGYEAIGCPGGTAFRVSPFEASGVEMNILLSKRGQEICAACKVSMAGGIDWPATPFWNPLSTHRNWNFECLRERLPNRPPDRPFKCNRA